MALVNCTTDPFSFTDGVIGVAWSPVCELDCSVIGAVDSGFFSVDAEFPQLLSQIIERKINPNNVFFILLGFGFMLL